MTCRTCADVIQPCKWDRRLWGREWFDRSGVSGLALYEYVLANHLYEKSGLCNCCIIRKGFSEFDRKTRRDCAYHLSDVSSANRAEKAWKRRIHSNGNKGGVPKVTPQFPNGKIPYHLTSNRNFRIMAKW